MKTDNSVLDNAQTKPVENGLCAERGPCRSLIAFLIKIKILIRK